MGLTQTITLSNGVEMPQFGLGVWQVPDGDVVINSVKWAIEAGYRHIDTAALYGNEEGVGKAIKASGIDRKELFITTKVANTDQGYESTKAAFAESLKKLDTDYVDLYLIHWPVADKFVDTWRAIEEIYEAGQIRAIGISNFHKHHFEKLMETAKITPMVNQVELHPLLAQNDLREFYAEHNIRMEAYSPLGSGALLQNEDLQKIADKYNKSVAQVILRWDLQHGIITIPKSVHQNRIEENANVFDFELAPEDMNAIDALNKDQRVGTNPEVFDNK